MDIVCALLDAGAHINQTNPVRQHSPEITTSDSSNHPRMQENGQTALTMALKQGYKCVAETLVNQGAVQVAGLM